MPAELRLTEMPGHLIRRLQQHATAVFQQRLKAAGYDLTSVQFSALATLSSNPGLDQAQLAKMIAYDRATIGGVVKRLEQKNLIMRSTNPNDRRAFNLALTPVGHATLQNITPIVIDLQNDILGSLTDAEKETMNTLIQKALFEGDSPVSPSAK